MGICGSKNEVVITTNEDDPPPPEEKCPAALPEYKLGKVGTYKLKKSRAGCTGMFWRLEPGGGKVLINQESDWPRDNAMIEGRVLTLEKEKWLRATRFKQPNDEEWTEAPEGAHLPFEYDQHYYLEEILYDNENAA